MSKRDRRDDGRDRDRRDGERSYRDRDRDWDDEGQQRRSGEGDIVEGDSVTALKAILSKVANLLKPLNLSADEAIRLVEQLYGSVLDMDLALAGEADDTRKSSTLAYINKTNIVRGGDNKLVVEFPKAEDLRPAEAPAVEAAPAQATAQAQAPAAAPTPAAAPPRTAPAQAATAADAAPPASEEAPREKAPAPRPPRPRPAPRKPAAAESAPEAPAEAPDA